jgi:hypothetical protein
MGVLARSIRTGTSQPHVFLMPFTHSFTLTNEDLP